MKCFSEQFKYVNRNTIKCLMIRMKSEYVKVRIKCQILTKIIYIFITVEVVWVGRMINNQKRPKKKESEQILFEAS